MAAARGTLHSHIHFRLGLIALLLCCGLSLAAEAQTLTEAKTAIDAGDYAKAAQIYQELAAQGDAKAQYNLGLMYASGDGVAADQQQALNWFRQAAEQGLAEAQYRLGVIYFRDDIVPIDYGEAIKWYRRAAEQGHAQSQLNLGVIYFGGAVVPQDYGQAVRWYELAAMQGNTEAQYNLGNMYLRADGVPQDLVRGHIWVQLSTLDLPAGPQRAKRERVLRFYESKMTAEQRAEAKQRLDACTADALRGC
jgi:TPR repeat protein